MPSLDTNGLKQRGQTMLAGFSTGQRAIVVLAVIALVAGGALFTQWVAKPSMTPLFSNLSSEDAASMTAALEKQNVDYTLSNGGATIMVPQSQVYQLRLDMAGEGLTSGSSEGYKLLDNPSITQSEFSEKTTYQRALEGELAKTIGTIDGVKAANVHLVIPQEDVFSQDAVKPTASVLVTTAQGKTLSSQAVQSVVNLTAGSVQGLVPDDVTVADSSGKLLSTQGGAGDSTDVQNQQTSATETQLNSKISSLITPLVGEGKAVVQTRAELTWDKSKTVTEQYNPTNKQQAIKSQQSQVENYGAGAGTNAATGCIGTQTPVNGVCQDPQGAGGTGATGYGTSNVTTDYAPDRQVTETEKAVGQPQRITVAVVLDSNAGNVDTTQIEQLVTNAAGLQPARGDAVTVTRMAFNQDAANSASETSKAAEKEAKSAAMVNYIKIGVTVLIILAVLVFLFLTTKRRAKLYQATPLSMAELDAGMASLPNGDGLLDALEASPVVVDTSPEALERQKVDREITDLIEKQPDEVAGLLRSWLADRRS